MAGHNTMKYLLVIGFACTLLVALPAQQVGAEPGLIIVTPDLGEMGTLVHLEQEGWEPGTPINLYASFTETGVVVHGDPFIYIKPAQKLVADEKGTWRADIQTADIRYLLGHDRSKPGFVRFQAAPADVPPSEQVPNGATFIVIADGVRPNGSGSIEVSVLGSLELGEGREALLSIRRVGDHFFRSKGAVTIPTEKNSFFARDGDWEVALRLPEDLSVSRSRSVRQLEAPLCGLLTRCPQELLFVQRVSVQDAGITAVTFVIKEKSIYTGSGEDSGRAELIAGASVLLAVLVVGVAAVAYRRTAG